MYANCRDSRGLQSTEGHSPSWLEYGEVFAYAGKERGLLFLMEMCVVCTLQEGLCGMVSISCFHALAALALSIPSVFHPSVSETHSPSM